MTACPEESEVLEFVEGRASVAALATMQTHLDECGACRELVANAADALLDSSPTGPRELDNDAERLRGSMIGRYTVLAREGAGGMGAVYSAYDPQLDRRIAVKLVRTDRLVRGDAGAMRAQVLREAQAMARLNHANVVAVYDVGTLGDELFIAMEYVEGDTLAAWTRKPGRTWREILACYMLAGEGLAAAHRSGLVHRDFKPDNVLIGDDGRVRVSDFGLASIRASDDSVELATIGTSTSTAIGTPAYMAPEQRAGQRVDARADQFSFCRALEQALFEQTATSAPAWLSVPLLRGQAVDREQRYPTMEPLLVALRRDPTRVRRRALTFAGVAALATIAAFGGAQWLHAQAQDPCIADGLPGVWDQPMRERVGAALRDSERANASDTAERVDATLTSYAGRWTAMHTEVCQATLVRAEQSEALFDLRMQCLARLRARMGALTEALATQRPAPIDEAVPAATSLPDVDACADVEQLLAVVPLPDDADARAEIEDAQARLDRLLLGQYFTGDAHAALAPTRELVAEARALAYPPLEHRALTLLADLQDALGDHATAEATLGEALHAAAAAHDDLAFGLDMIRLVAIIGSGENRFAEAELAARITESVLVRAGGSDEDLAGLYSERAQLARAQAHLHEARALQERALVLLDAAPTASPAARAGERSNLATTLIDLGETDEALVLLGHAREMLEQELGPAHPLVATIIYNIGAAQVASGAVEEGMLSHRAAIAIWERAYGPDHVMVGDALDSLASAEQSVGKNELARRDEERAIDVLTRALGPDHLEVAWARNNYGGILCDLGEHDEGIAQLERALAIAETALGPDHPDLSYPLSGLAECHLGRRAPASAIPALERALGVLAHGEGSDVQHRIDENRARLERARVSP